MNYEKELEDAGTHWRNYLEEKKMKVAIQPTECGCFPYTFKEIALKSLKRELYMVENIELNALKGQVGTSQFNWGPVILEKKAEIALLEYTIKMLESFPVCSRKKEN